MIAVYKYALKVIVIIWKLVYNLLFLPLLSVFLPLGRLFFPKIRRTAREHHGLWQRTAGAMKNRRREKLVWIHASSAGEYMQGKPLAEVFARSGFDVVFTVTSVSGYRWISNDPPADILHYEYYPLDYIWNADRFLKLIRPSAIVFIKTDLWPNLVWRAHKANVPMFLSCAVLSEQSGKYNSSYVKSYYLSLIRLMSEIMAVEKEDAERFEEILKKRVPVSVMGDTRYDSVVKRKELCADYDLGWKKENTFILGSLREAEFAIVLPFILKILQTGSLNVIAAPHEIDEKTLCRLEEYFAGFECRRFSDFQKHGPKTGVRVLIVDTIGHLFSLYKNASWAYVGGAFTSGVHNVLEPGVLGLPIIIGPRYHKFRDVSGMVESNIILSAEDPKSLGPLFDKFVNDPAGAKKLGALTAQYISERANSAPKIAARIIESAKNPIF